MFSMKHSVSFQKFSISRFGNKTDLPELLLSIYSDLRLVGRFNLIT